MTKRKTKLLPGIAVAVATLGLLGAVTYVFFWNPTPDWKPAPNEAATQITSEELAQMADLRVFFGHMSVGQNVMSGLADVYGAKGVELPEIVEIAPGEVPELSGDGVLVHALIGENYYPLGKLENFDATLRAGLADNLDVALLKFCYVDIGPDTDVEALFAKYQETMDSLEGDYPNVRFIHATAPLTVGPHGIRGHLKVLVKGDLNVQREKYNELMRSAYGSDQLFDIADLESTAPDGSKTPELYPGYTSDGEHLNDTGSALAAVELAELLTSSGR